MLQVYVSDTSQTKSNYILGKIIFSIVQQIALISGRLCIIYFLCFYGFKKKHSHVKLQETSKLKR